MNCGKCGNELTGKQKRFCSAHCSKLFLKAEYRRRNRSKINEYNNKRKRMGIRKNGKELIKRYLHLQTGKCFICGETKTLQVHHIKPRVFGGTNEPTNLMLLCKIHHFKFEEATYSFWKKIPIEKVEIVS